MENPKRTKVYVGCALTHVTQEYRDLIEGFKNALRKNSSLEILDFMGVINGTDEEIYEYDVGYCVETCNIFLAICDHAATALGYELATAIEKRGIPVLAVAHQNSLVSSMITGINHPKFTFKRYEDLMADVPSLLREKIAAHFATP